jgi:hypothetical protein
MLLRPIAINSTVLYTLAFLATTILHELGHAVTGMLLGSHPILHHNYVDHRTVEDLSSGQQIAIALAGPVISLVQGLGAGFIFLNSRRRSLAELFVLWWSVLGFTNFFGYLMTGPVFSAGDIGKAYAIAGTPLWIQILLAVVGAALLLVVAYRMTSPFLQFSSRAEWLEDGAARKRFSLHALILPWIVGSAIITLLYLPIVAVVSIIYPVMSGMVFIFPWQNAVNIRDVQPASSVTIERTSVAAIVALVIVGGVFRLILAPGIPL